MGDEPGNCAICEEPVCADGEWSCETIEGCDDCSPPNACNGPNDCDDGDAPACESGQAAQCVHDDAGAFWSCERCAVVETSDLDGVVITFPDPVCSFTLEEVAAGISIPYEIRVTEAHTVTPTSQQNGCDEPGPSGLRPFPRIHGNDQEYCLCDVGLCADTTMTTEVATGVYEGTIEWEGRNWSGPSDTGNPMGEPFGVGGYDVEVKALGEVDAVPYEVLGTLKLRLTP